MRFIDLSGSIYEVHDGKINIQKASGTVISYSIRDMLYPKQIKDNILGKCTLTLHFSEKTTIHIVTKKENRVELERFLEFLIVSYEHASNVNKGQEKYIKKHESSNISNATFSEPKLIECPCCKKLVSNAAFSCPNCGQPLAQSAFTPNSSKSEPDEFKGIYKQTLLHGLQEVYCPRCGSSNCSHYQEQRIIPGKTKTSYSMNLNPLKPFTVVNKKEKVVRKEKAVTVQKFICNKCGNIFF